MELRRGGSGDEDMERKFQQSEKRRRALEEKWELAYQEKEIELRRLKEDTLRYEYMRRDLEAKMRADDERRVNEQKVEAATLQMMRQVFSDVVRPICVAGAFRDTYASLRRSCGIGTSKGNVFVGSNPLHPCSCIQQSCICDGRTK